MVKTLKIREISIQIRQTSKLRIWRSNPFAPDLATFAPRKYYFPFFRYVPPRSDNYWLWVVELSDRR